MISALVSRLVILVFGLAYPAYASYKAVRTKNVKEYVKWMMYWIVFAFFTCIETCTDIFLSWFPFYYEIKVLIVVWLLSPATKGSSTLYRKFVHPMLTRREQEIDDYLYQAKERGYSAVLQLGSKGVNYATNVIMQTAIKGGGNLFQTIKRSYSLSDLSEPDCMRVEDEMHELTAQRRILRPRAIGRSSSGTRHSTGMYFTEVELSSQAAAGDYNSNIKSLDDSSGYSSTNLSRTSSLTNASKSRYKGKRTEITNPEMEIIDNLRFGNNSLILDEISSEDESNNKDGRILFVYTKASPFNYTYVDKYLNRAAGDYGFNQIKANDQTEMFNKKQENNECESKNKQSNPINDIDELSISDIAELKDLKPLTETIIPQTLEMSKPLHTKADESSEEDEFMDTITENTEMNLNFLDKELLSPQSLRLSLQEISNSFLKSIENETDQNETTDLTKNIKPHLYNKGKAPAPPQAEIQATVNKVEIETEV